MQLVTSASSFLYPLFLSVFTVALAYVFSETGYEAFIAVSISLGVLLTLLTFHILRFVFRSKYWRVVKLLSVPPIVLAWFLTITGVAVSIFPGKYSLVTPPDINWWLVLVGTLPYLLPRLYTMQSRLHLRQLMLGVLTVLYSVIVLVVAATYFHNSASPDKGMMMVVGVQLQYLIGYTVLKTEYIQKSYDFANKAATKLKIDNNSLGLYLLILVVGLPLIIPTALVAHIYIHY